MEAKFTKGEWSVNSANIQEVNSYNGTSIADCSKSIMINNSEKEANAKLIAAAPEMYEALGSLITKTEELASIVYLITKEQGDSIRQAKAALKKAME